MFATPRVAVRAPTLPASLSSHLCPADIFWVFATPVMVAVAKNFDAPIKLLFPRGPLDALGAL